MANTYTLIASSTVGAGGASSIDFTSIPSTYTDLVLKMSLRSNRTEVADNLKIWFNGSTTNFTNKNLYGTGSGTPGSSSDTGIYPNTNANTSTSSTFANIEMYIPNYAGSNYKSGSIDAVTENNETLAYTNLMASLWSNTTAINQITIYPYSGTLLLQYSTAYLYGVKNA